MNLRSKNAESVIDVGINIIRAVEYGHVVPVKIFDVQIPKIIIQLV